MNRKPYLASFMETFSFPEEAENTLLSAYDTLCGDKKRVEVVEEIVKTYTEDRHCDFSPLLDRICALSEEAGVSENTGVAVVYLCLTEPMKAHYNTAGYSEEMWETMVKDLLYKIKECKSVFGMWGISSQTWFFKIFSLETLAFCKLQFQLGRFGHTYEKDGLVLTKDSAVVHVHIPNSGEPLDVASKDKSYRMAAEFYQKSFGDGPVIFTCTTWMLFPRLREILKPTSNILAFMNDYEEVFAKDYPNYDGVWRIFGRNYDGDVEKLPQTNSLQRAYGEWIRNGEPVGYACGIIRYQL